jgi:hypothetical protein
MNKTETKQNKTLVLLEWMHGSSRKFKLELAWRWLGSGVVLISAF